MIIGIDKFVLILELHLVYWIDEVFIALKRKIFQNLIFLGENILLLTNLYVLDLNGFFEHSIRIFIFKIVTIVNIINFSDFKFVESLLNDLALFRFLLRPLVVELIGEFEI